MSAPGFAAAYDAVAHVFVDALAHECTVGGDDGRHLTRVRRLRAGEVVTAADGSGAWRPYDVARVDGHELVLEARADARDEPERVPRVAVAFALTKGEKPERVVAQLTELGVQRIAPVLAARSVVRWDDARRAAALERFARVAREAAMQSRRSRLPAVDPVAPLASLAGHPALLVAERGAGAPPTGRPPGGEWLAVVGPEGGLTAEEVERLAPRARLGVGPFVLRAETAAVAAGAALALDHRNG